MDGPAGMHEAQAVALELLHDESFAAEQPDADAALKRDADRHAARRAEERVLLANELSTQLLQIHREDLARVRRGERHLLLAASRVGEHRHEQTLTGDEPLAGAEHARP